MSISEVFPSHHPLDFDVVVIGAGHAGCEAGHAAAKMGMRVALVTLNPERIGFMSCNPAMGGLAKGQLIKEIDALGGIMGRNTDATAIQYRRLNSSKGPAVRSSRAQCDKLLYAATMAERLSLVSGLKVVRGEVADLLTESSAGRVSVRGVRLKDGSDLKSRAVIITSGTFLRAVMFTGFAQTEGGRVGDAAALGLSTSLERLGFRLSRLKTGTPPRLHRRSIDFSKCEAQAGDTRPIPFSFYQRLERFPALPQVNCFITYTNPQTHEIIEKNFDKSPMFTGIIKGVGPRYCPSIEDKVKRFRDRDRHQLFLEPEGLSTDEIYVNGISTSLPEDVQRLFVRSVSGLEQAEFTRFGYAVEYDAIDARQLKLSLECKSVEGLFCAGQINGTSGYEEAGAQGLIAGVNAARMIQQQEAFTLSRSDAYIGVMIDDLTTQGTDEPYRMFTSRAEYRLLLREDNADLRLGDAARHLGMLGDHEYAMLTDKRERISRLRTAVQHQFLYPTAERQAEFEARGWTPLKDRLSFEVLLRRPEVHWETLAELGFLDTDVATNDHFVREQVEIQIKYEGYIQRDLDLLEGVRKHEGLKIPDDLDFGRVSGLSNEARGRLELSKPETLGQASRLAGMTPAAVANLLVHLKIRQKATNRHAEA